jgi:hypothetical protein
VRIVSTATLVLIAGTAHAQHSNPEVARHLAAADIETQAECGSRSAS